MITTELANDIGGYGLVALIFAFWVAVAFDYLYIKKVNIKSWVVGIFLLGGVLALAFALIKG